MVKELNGFGISPFLPNKYPTTPDTTLGTAILAIATRVAGIPGTDSATIPPTNITKKTNVARVD
jgi:hypothetical protein